ncbi:right-handed parallel beta-helix repeat-containing protein [Chthonobacter albigriseus]|uniref:right-handed parallel beta-helix repeat-containing protein n=1 Tax=Chthonobacter albigriseus TaxID=1683161 RepID=UPI0015EEC449|nr:right-handed parallel beta-helix repeat-containing protein [Chthonobacter albigriseus]
MLMIMLRTASIAALAGALVFAAPVGAQTPVPAASGSAIVSIGSLDGPAIDRLAESIARRAEAGAASPGETLRALQSSLEDLSVIETVARRPASPDPRTDAITKAAKRALLGLATRGIDRDRLSRRAVAAESDWVRAGALNPADLTAAFADLDRLSADISDPSAKVEALIRIGRTHQAIGNVDRAIRYGQLAERAARDIAPGEERDRALADVLQLATAGDASKTLGIVSAALAGFTDGNRRAEAIGAVARRIGAGPVSLLDDVRAAKTPVAAAVWPMLGAGDAMALDELKAIAVERMEDEAAMLIASSAPDAEAQDKALAAIAEAQVAQRRSFAALDTARLMLTAARPRYEATIARELAEVGYDLIARSVADRVIADAAATPDAVAEARAALAEVAEPTVAPATIEEHAADLRALPFGGDERETAAAVVEAVRGSELRASLEKIRALSDYRVRISAFRAVAEIQAAKLDVDGRIASRHVPASGGNQSADEHAPAILQAAGMRLTTGAGVTLTTPTLVHTVPDISATADTVRRMVPVPLPGVSELSLAGLNRFTQLNRFNSKFLEDVVGTTAREHIFKTQGTINPTFIYLTNGVFTARDLLHAIDTSSGSQLVRIDGVYTLRVPLVIGPDATLVLSGQDAPEFRISASAGAFIINAGKLFLVDTSLVGWDEAKRGPSLATYETKHQFRPFITTWSGSETFIAGSRLLGLGYSAGKSYGITLSSGPKEGSRTSNLPRPRGLFVDSSFDNLLYGFYTYEADDVLVVGNEYRDSIVYGLDPHDRSQRLVMAYNTLYGTMKKHGAIFSRDVEHSHLIGNVSFDNAGSGIMMDRRSSLNWIYANTAIGNAQDGMTVYESPCLLIANNAFVDNGRSGVKIRNSWKVLVERNHVAANNGPGIESYVADLAATDGGELRNLEEDPYLRIASFAAHGNTVVRNTVGITARDTSEVELSGNLFVDQTPGVFDGELKPLRVHLLQFAGGNDRVTARPIGTLPPEPELAEEAGVGFCPPPGRIPTLAPAITPAATTATEEEGT